MHTHAAKSQSNRTSPAAMHASRSSGPAIQLRELQQLIQNSHQVRQLKALQEMADNRLHKNGATAITANAAAVVQRFKINQYDDYQGYLAGEDSIRSTERVRAFIKMLKDGKQLPADEPIKAAKNVDMVKETRKDMPWQYLPLDEYSGKNKKPEVEKKHVLTDGHHRFVAYVEVGAELPKIQSESPGGNFGYSWSTMGGMEEEYEESQSSKMPVKEKEKEGKKEDKKEDKETVKPVKRVVETDPYEMDSGNMEYDEWSNMRWKPKAK